MAKNYPVCELVLLATALFVLCVSYSRADDIGVIPEDALLSAGLLPREIVVTPTSDYFHITLVLNND